MLNEMREIDPKINDIPTFVPPSSQFLILIPTFPPTLCCFLCIIYCVVLRVFYITPLMLATWSPAIKRNQ